MKKIFCSFPMYAAFLPYQELQAQNIQLHYDFGRSLYDKDLKGRPLLTSTSRSSIPTNWGKYLLLYRYGLYVRRGRFRLLGDSP